MVCGSLKNLVHKSFRIAISMFQIGEISRRLGINSQTIYFYERIGLIPSPQRTEAGYRIFSTQDVDRLDFIVRAKSLGLSLDEIKEILTLKDGRSLTCQAVYQRLYQKVNEIQINIQKLQILHDELQPLLEQCRRNFNHPDPNHECTVIEQGLEP
jgi:DNA-binding transcriptional MerR regulator